MVKVRGSRYWSGYFRPAAIARRPERLLPFAVVFVTLYFVVVNRQRSYLELNAVDREIEAITKAHPEVAKILSTNDLADLAVKQAKLAKETADLAYEVEHLVGSIKGIAQKAAETPDAPAATGEPYEHHEVPSFSGTQYSNGVNTWKTVKELKEQGVNLDGWVREGPSAAADINRREAVKGAMKHAWDSYVRLAWGLDELQPVSKRGKNLFGGMGLTIIDSLDTLYIMGLIDEFNKAKQWIFDNLKFEHTNDVSVFETIIRYVGGFMSAYDLSGDHVFVDKCVDLCEKLMPAFNTGSGIPLNIINLHSGHAKNPAWTGGASTLAEFGSMQLEYVALSHHTGNDKYAQLTEKIIKVIAKTDPGQFVPESGRGLYPLYIDPNNAEWKRGNQKITFGAMGDSFYEYLIKMWVQGGRTPALQKYRDMFDAAMWGMENLLIGKSNPSELVYIAEWAGSRQAAKMDHLACFVPGMLVLGADGKYAEGYVALAQQLMHTCVQMYFRQPTGLAPEAVQFVNGQDMVGNPRHNLLRPETVESLMLLYRKTGDPIYREWGWLIFQAFEKHCRTEDAGYSGLKDVSQPNPVKDDTMQSFFLAETLKYLFLLFDDTNHIPLDEWVFTTEAHPLKVHKRETSYVN